jgi:hypothetical protein
MKTNGKLKVPRAPIFVIDGQEFVVACGSFECNGHAAAVELGENPGRVCKRDLAFTGATIQLPAAGKRSTLDGICPILLIEEA